MEHTPSQVRQGDNLSLAPKSARAPKNPALLSLKAAVKTYGVSKARLLEKVAKGELRADSTSTATVTMFAVAELDRAFGRHVVADLNDVRQVVREVVTELFGQIFHMKAG